METLTLVREREGRTEVWEITWAGLAVEIASGTVGRPLSTKVKNFGSPREVEAWLRSELDRQLKAGFKISDKPIAPAAGEDDEDDDDDDAPAPARGKAAVSAGPAVAKRKATPRPAAAAMSSSDGPLRVLVASPGKPSALGSRVGGMPLAPSSMDWPDCACCDKPMRFVGQLRLREVGADRDGLLTLWHCTSTGDKACPSGDPTSGAARAIVLDEEDLVPMLAPPSSAEITLLRTQTITAEALAGRISDPARAYADTLEARREVVGLVGAQLWVGAATTATCKPCKAPMKPLLQLEAHAGGGLGLGGGGRGYAQLCSACGAAAWFVQRVK